MTNLSTIRSAIGTISKAYPIQEIEHTFAIAVGWVYDGGSERPWIAPGKDHICCDAPPHFCSNLQAVADTIPASWDWEMYVNRCGQRTAAGCTDAEGVVFHACSTTPQRALMLAILQAKKYTLECKRAIDYFGEEQNG